MKTTLRDEIKQLASLDSEFGFDYQREEREASHTLSIPLSPLVTSLHSWLRLNSSRFVLADGLGALRLFRYSIVIKMNVSGAREFQSWFPGNLVQVTPLLCGSVFL